jgi:hypothetical protein
MPLENLYAVGWEDTTYIYPDKSFAEVEVGDRKQAEFYPQVKIKRWMNECNFSARLKTEHNNPEVVEEEGKIKWKNGDIEAHFYELAADGEQLEEGGLEFEIVYKKKPKSNVVEFTIQTKGLDFFYQPPLTQAEIDRGDKQPENVVGSYAVYHKTKKNNRYKTGKAFHIYRPHVIDSDDNETWADLYVDVEAGTLEITVPQHFLDSAVYPVTVDPTLGYTSIGASNITYTNEIAVGTKWTTPSGDTGEGRSLTIYCDHSTGGSPQEDVYIRAGLWNSSHTILSQSSKLTIHEDAAAAWRQVDWTPGSGGSDVYPTISPSTTYWIGGVFDKELFDSVRVWYDTGDTGQSLRDTSNDIDNIEDLGTGSPQDRKYSWYLTYGFIYDESLTDGVNFSDIGEHRIRTQYYRLIHDGAGVANQYFDLDYTVDPDNTFLITHISGKDNNAANKNTREWGIRSRITADGTQIHLVRSATNSDAVVSCQVVECFNGEFSVQHSSSQVEFDDVNLTVTDTISSIDTSKSMIIVACGARYDAQTRADMNFVTAEFNSATEIQFERGRTADNGEDCMLYWQVVTFNADYVTVQTGEVDCSGDISAGITEAISSVDTSRAWVYTQYRTPSTSNNESGYSVRTRLTSPTQLTIDRYTTLEKAAFLRYWVVEWPEEVTVYHYADSTIGTNNVSPTVDTYQEGQVLFDVNASSEDSSEVRATCVVFWEINALTDSTTIQMRRYVTLDQTDTEYALQMIDFSNWRVSYGVVGDSFAAASTEDGIEFSDTPAVIATPNTTLIDGVVFGDPVIGGTIEDESATDGLLLGDSTQPGNIIDSSLTDGILIGDITAGLKVLEESALDGIDFGETLEFLHLIERSVSDGVEFGDTLTATSGAELFVTDGIIFSEVISSFFGTMDYMTEGIELGDTPVPSNVIDRGLTDGIDFSDTPTIESIVNALLTDGLVLGDTTILAANVVTSPSDGLVFSDTNDPDAQIFRSASDGMIFSDTIDPEALINGVLTDGLTLGDSLDHSIDFNVAPSDGMTFGEQLEVLFTAAAAANDGVVFGDEALPFRVFAEFATDGVIFADVTETATDFVTSLTEGLVFSEILIGDLGGRLIILEAKEVDYYQQANPVPYTFIARDVEYLFTARIPT